MPKKKKKKSLSPSIKLPDYGNNKHYWGNSSYCLVNQTNDFLTPQDKISFSPVQRLLKRICLNSSHL